MTSRYPLSSGSSTHEFKQARRQATFGMLLTKLRGEPTALLSFEEARQKLRLTSQAYRGVRITLHQSALSQIDERPFSCHLLVRHDLHFGCADHSATGHT